VNILFLATWFPYPHDNGSKLRAYYLIRALSQKHKVTLLSFAFETATPDSPGELKKWCSEIRVAPVDPFQANRAGTLRTFLSSRPVATRSVPAMSQLAEDELRRNAYDAVIASTGMTAEYALRVGRVPPNTARILEGHNSMSRWMQGRYTAQTKPLQRLRCWASWRKALRFEAALFRRFDLVTMVSEQDRHVCMTQLPGYRGPVEVVSNGVECSHNCPGLAQPQPNALVFNGSLTYSANYDAMRWFLADVYPRIEWAAPAVTLTITGSLRGVDTAGLALDDTVRLTGYVEDVRRPVAEATVCVVPIRQGGGTRLKILEAMALGTPTIATSKGAEGLEVTDGEHLLLADDPESFATGVVELLRNPAIRRRLAASARRLVEQRYDWQAIGSRFVDLVEEAVLMRNHRTLAKLNRAGEASACDRLREEGIP
jgi:glycosyltransferase involved in cell wall biosynthesis